MSVTLAVTNCGLRKFSLPGFTTMDALPTVTKTKVVKQVNADDRSTNFDRLGKFGVAISENGTYRTGAVAISGAAVLTATQQVAICTIAADYTLGLPALASVPVGHKIFIHLRSRSGGTLTIDGNSSETVLGQANQTTATAGYILRIEKATAGATNWTAQTI